MKLVDLIAQYLAFLTAKGLSSHTRRTYGNQMRHYARWWESTHETAPDLTAFCEADLFAYIQGEEKRGQRPRSRHSKACALRSFGKWLVTFGHLSDNPAARLPLPRLDDPQRELMTASEVAAMLSACERFPKHDRGILAKAVLVTFLTTGVRRSELLALCVSDIDFAGRVLIVRHGKGGKFRQMPLHDEALEVLHAWLAVRSPHAATDRLFLSNRTHALGTISLRNLINEAAAIAGLRGKKNLAPHSQRYYFTDMLVENWVDIKTIQDLLGHSSVKTTWSYIRTNMDRKRRAVDAIHLPGTQAPKPPKEAPVDKPKRARRISLRD